MAKITYEGREITHTAFLSMLRSKGISSGYMSAYEVLKAMAADGNKTAKEILSKLTYED